MSICFSRFLNVYNAMLYVLKSSKVDFKGAIKNENFCNRKDKY